MRRAIAQSLAWQAEGLPPVRVAVNVSARQIDGSDDFAEVVARLLEETGLAPEFLDLEIIEGALLSGEEQVIELLGRLRKLGVGLSLDDFGTGYSSLSYLRRMPIDTLKVDRHERQVAPRVEARVGAEPLRLRSQPRLLRGRGGDVRSPLPAGLALP
jgi:EAL domain-containing protein (putative c-di-GMP-specific phosphodiesterase class I)